MKPSRIDIERELGRRSLYDFVKLAWHVIEPSVEFQDNWHIKLICEKLESVSRGECKRLIINVPPGSAKSTLVCVCWDAWDWLQNPSRKFLYTSFDARLTRRDGKRTLDLVSSKWFRERWGSVFNVPPDAASADFKTDRGGSRFATSVKGKTTGEHPDILVVDDPSKPKEVNDKSLEEVVNWWKSTILSRGNQLTVARVIIMQRLHENDLCGYLLRTEPHEWEVVRIPLEFQPEQAHPEDPRTELGEIFWKARHNEKTVATLKGSGGLGPRHYSAQYQQDPAPAEGLIFFHKWLSGRCAQLPDRWDDSCQSWDMSFKDSDGSDWVVGQVWLRQGSSYYLVDQVRAKMAFTAACQAVKDLSKKWPKVRAKVVEDKANGPAVVDHLKREVSGLILVNPEGGKIARANAVTAFFEAGNVHLVEADWTKDYVDEMTRFPTASHDDQVDATSQALTFLADRNRSYAEAMKNAKSVMGGLTGSV